MIGLFTNPLPIEESTQKADGINLRSGKKPHMRGLLFSALSFHIAFSGWFAFPPLITTIQKDLKLSKNDIFNANIASVSSTILFRLFIGPFCDLYGPKRVMAAILLIGSIPVAFSGLAHDGTSLIILRFFIGILGASFVPCQFWTTQMFSSKAVGTANAIAGGWGNMGAGLTYLVLPLIFDAFKAGGVSDHVAWRVTLLVPFVLIVLVAVCDLLFADDCPQGDWKNRYAPRLERVEESNDEVKEKKKDEVVVSSGDSEKQLTPSSRPKVQDFVNALKDFNVIILMLQYACCFGFELAIDNVISTFFQSKFTFLTQTTAGLIGALFGLMNFVSRPSGGIFSDYLNEKMGIRGRLILQFLVLFLEGACLVVFYFSLQTLGSAIVVLLFFSYFTEACAGTTFGIVPYVNPSVVGAVSGLVGAGGNVGGLILNVVFKVYQANIQSAFLVIGIACMCVSTLTFLLKVQGKRIVNFK